MNVDERAGERGLGWLWNPLCLGLLMAVMATWNRGFAVLAVVILTACLAVSERLIYWQRRKIEHLEARR